MAWVIQVPVGPAMPWYVAAGSALALVGLAGALLIEPINRGGANLALVVLLLVASAWSALWAYQRATRTEVPA